MNKALVHKVVVLFAALIAAFVAYAPGAASAPAPYTKGDIFIATDGTHQGRLAAGSSGKVLTANGAGEIPSWETAGAGTNVPTGTVLMWPTSTAPTGYYICDGAEKSRTTDADLFAVVGTTFGAGDTSTTFNLPNYAGRVPLGFKSSDTDFDTVGETGGAKTVASAGTNSAPVFTGVALGTHLHGIGTYDAAATSAGTPAGTIAWPAGVPTFSGSALGTHAHGIGSYVAANESAHTHTTTATGTVSQPTFTGNAVTAASTAATPDLVTSNTAGSGVSPTTTATGTVSQPTFTGNSVTSSGGSAHTHTLSGTSEAISAGTPAGTIAWPGGVPTLTGAALATHDHALSGSSEAVSAGTPAGAVSAPTFTGSSTSVVQPYMVIYFIIKK